MDVPAHERERVPRHDVAKLRHADAVAAFAVYTGSRWIVRTKLGTLKNNVRNEANDKAGCDLELLLLFVPVVTLIASALDQVGWYVLKVSYLLAITITIFAKLLHDPILVAKLVGESGDRFPERQRKDFEV